MNKVLVSVIIPTYKRSNMLERAINSALNQTLEAIEVIVVDDNNPDTEYRKSTEAFMQRYADDSRVVYIKHESNKNGAAARNTGIKNAKGEYIALLDDDDFFYPTKLIKQVEYLSMHPEYEGVYCGRVQNGKEILGEYIGDLSEYILTQKFTPTTPALMFRKEALIEIGGFDESFRRHQDYELLLKFFRKFEMGAIKEPLVEIGTNFGENELHGNELEDNKHKFLKLFEDDINRIDGFNPGFKKEVYIVNLRAVFCDHLSMHKYQNAWKIYKKGCKLSFVKFNINIFNYVMYYIKVKIRKKLKHKH